jgi:hypothetical protein
MAREAPVVRRFYKVAAERACQSKNHKGPRRHITKGHGVDPCERCAKWTCTECEGSSLFGEVCDACWLPTLKTKPPPTWGTFWEVLEARQDDEESKARSCRATCNALGWAFSRHVSGYWCAEKAVSVSLERPEAVTVVIVSAPTAAQLRRLVKLCSRALRPAPPPASPPPATAAEDEELPTLEVDGVHVVALPEDTPEELPPNVLPLRRHASLGLEVKLGAAAATSSSGGRQWR